MMINIIIAVIGISIIGYTVYSMTAGYVVIRRKDYDEKIKRIYELETIIDFDREKEKINASHNRINISYRDCLQTEIESGELSYDELEEKALNLLKIVKGHLVDSESEPNANEVA